MLAGSPGSVSCGIPVPFLWVLVCMRFCLCPLWLKSLFPPVFWKSYNQIPLAFRSDSLESPSSFVRSLGLEAWHGIQNLHNSGRTSLVLLFSSLWVTHPMVTGLDFIVIMPLLLSCFVFFFVFGCGVSFFFLVCSSILLSIVVQQLVAVLVLFQGEMSACPSTLPSWTACFFTF